jgi:hypothetical protein
VTLVLVDAERLHIVSDAGATVRVVGPPPGYAFSHLVEGESAVVCRGDVPRGGWRDWRFDIDPVTGRLARAAPAY